MTWKNEDININGTSSAKCPNCGASVFYNEKLGKLFCAMCGGLYDPESMKSAGRIENRDTADAGSEEDNKQEFVCDSCGAAVVTDYNTSATFCAFCGSPTLINRRLSRAFRPDVLIPFKISKEEAIANYLKWAKTQKGVPKRFTSEAVLSKITGYYIPFWLIDADCKSEVSGTGQKFKDENIENYEIDRTLVYNVRRVPFDGCKKISNTLMEAIEPYDYKEIKDYNDMYLPGFFAQRYDLSALDMMDIIRIRLDNYAEGIVKRLSAKEYDYFKAVGVRGAYSDNYSQLYALMPVWFLNIEYEGAMYSIAVNGQTGKASGSLPINKRRVHTHALVSSLWEITKYIILTALVPALGVALLMFLIGNKGGDFDWFYWMMFFVLWAVALISGLVFIVPHVRKKFIDSSFFESVTIDKAPNIDEYIDLKSGFKMDIRDTFMYMSTKADDDKNKEFSKEPLSVKVLNKIFK